MNTTWNTTIDEWIVLSRCNRVAEQLFSRDQHAADEFGRLAYQRWILEGITPEQLRDRRAPGMSDRQRLRKWKQLKAKGFPGAMS
ncbi:hypothetical protein [Synechococcus sp. A15-62]|uniref:hypothetical protein n=1 Tax=Synechococcus sp. A15-62 TaxID=1050657 RepID=UPI0016491EB2|nr:hypothetical protein [Synechococcus sp. A15-62]